MVISQCNKLLVKKRKKLSSSSAFNSQIFASAIGAEGIRRECVTAKFRWHALFCSWEPLRLSGRLFAVQGTHPDWPEMAARAAEVEAVAAAVGCLHGSCMAFSAGHCTAHASSQERSGVSDGISVCVLRRGSAGVCCQSGGRWSRQGGFGEKHASQCCPLKSLWAEQHVNMRVGTEDGGFTSECPDAFRATHRLESRKQIIGLDLDTVCSQRIVVVQSMQLVVRSAFLSGDLEVFTVESCCYELKCCWWFHVC